MDLVKAVSKNTLYLMAGDVAAKIISFAVSIAFVRYLGSEKLGMYSVAMAYLFFFGAISTLSHESVLGRELASRPDKEAGRWLGAALLLRVVCSFAGAGLALAGLIWFPASAEIRVLIFIACVGMLASFRSLFIAVFQKKMKMGGYVIATAFLNVASAVGTLLLIFAKGTVAHFMWFFTGMGFVTAAVYWGMSRGRVAVDWKGCGKFIVPLFKASFPVAVSHFFDRILARWDQIMIFTFAGTAAVGLYSACVTLNEGFLFIPVSLATSLLPILSSFFSESSDKLGRSVKLGGKYLAVAGFPAAIALSFFAPAWIRLAFGGEYSGAAPILAVLAWSLPLLFFLTFARQVLLSVRRQNAILRGTLAGAAVNVALNFWWTPQWGAVGAAWAAVAGNAVAMAGFFTDAAARREMVQLLRGIAKVVPSAAAMILICFNPKDPQGVTLFIGLAVYFLLLILTRALDREDWRLFQRTWRVSRG